MIPIDLRAWCLASVAVLGHVSAGYAQAPQWEEPTHHRAAQVFERR